MQSSSTCDLKLTGKSPRPCDQSYPFENCTEAYDVCFIFSLNSILSRANVEYFWFSARNKNSYFVHEEIDSQQTTRNYEDVQSILVTVTVK